MRTFLVVVLIGFIGWDVATTYYGTLSIFVEGNMTISVKLSYADNVTHIVAGIFSVGLIVFILSYKIIFNAENAITKTILILAFVYDISTSFYGVGEMLHINYDFFKFVRADWVKFFVVSLLAVMTTASPLLISHIVEDSPD